VKEPLRRRRARQPRWTVQLPDFAQSLAWSPDGALLAVATLAGPVLILDGDTGLPVARDPGHSGGAMCVCWSPDGQRLVTGGQDGAILTLDRTHGTATRHAGGGTWVEHLAFSSDGVCLASAAGRIVRLWTPDFDLLAEATGYESTITSLFWLPHTWQVVTSCYGGLQFFQAGREDWVRRLDWKGSILTACPSPDGKYIATGNQDASVHVWNTQTGRDLQMSGYVTKVRELAWSERGPLLATGGGEVVTLWSFEGAGPAGKPPVTLTGHEGRVSGLVFGTTGDWLLSCGEDGALIRWERSARGWRLGRVYDLEVPLFSLCKRPDDQRVALAGRDGQLSVVDL
jgi:WD40 repeat protein